MGINPQTGHRLWTQKPWQQKVQNVTGHILCCGAAKPRCEGPCTLCGERCTRLSIPLHVPSARFGKAALTAPRRRHAVSTVAANSTAAATSTAAPRSVRPPRTLRRTCQAPDAASARLRPNAGIAGPPSRQATPVAPRGTMRRQSRGRDSDSSADATRAVYAAHSHAPARL